MPRTLSRCLLLGLPVVTLLALAGQTGGPERTIIRTATIDGVTGPVYYSSLERRYLTVGTANDAEIAGLDATDTQ